MPGVLMVEALVQTARRLLEQELGGHWVLGEAKAVRYGALVQPGMVLRTSITVKKGGQKASNAKGKASETTGRRPSPDDLSCVPYGWLNLARKP